ncbi:MAG: AAA family ATPase, partial [Proteobacteria bacterium]|nr:AAA family ATPase [Pseudomonadota bacterium]
MTSASGNGGSQPGSQPGSQDEIIRLLSDPATFGPEGGPGAGTVDRVETHVSLVFLGPGRVYKLKRAVTFPYLDFSTPGKRRLACEAEVRINRRTAPSIYLGVVAITREADGTLALDGDGEAVDWVVEMKRFDEDTLFDRLARKGGLDRAMMEDLADAIAEFHQNAEPRADGGGRGGIAMIIDSNAECFAGAGEGILEKAKAETLTGLSQKEVEAVAPVLDRRRDSGRVRHCHGDLHLRNICIVEGRPTLFDAIEFNDAFATIDVLYDLAFLLMDLEHRGLGRLANIVFNRYLDVTGDGAGEAGGMPVMALFLSMRAAIRSHVDAAQAEALSDRGKARVRAEEASDYLNMALNYLAPEPPRLIAVGGLSGSGKSRMARELAPFLGVAPGARVVRSDSTRKRLAGVPLTERLGEEGYSAEMTERTFEAVYEEALAGLRAGQSVIADAVFADPESRRAIERVAKEARAPFAGLWLEAPA